MRAIKMGDIIFINNRTNHIVNAPLITGNISIISTHPDTMGEVKVSVGGIDGTFDGATSKKPIASCIKIFLMLLILDMEICNLNTKCYDLPGFCFKNKFY